MGSAVSQNSNSTVTQTPLQKQNSFERKNEEYIDIIPPSSHQYQKSSRNNTVSPSSNSNVTLPPPDNSELSSHQTSEVISQVESNTEVNGDEDAGTEKNKDKGNIEIEETMKDEELEQFRTEAFDCLRETAVEVVALEIRHGTDGAFVNKICNAAILFNKSYFILKETVRENIEQFRSDVAQLMVETKYFSLGCEIIMYTYKNGWNLEDGNVDQKKFIPLICSMSSFQNFSDACDEFAIALANEPGFLETIKQMLQDFLQDHFAKGEESRAETINERLMDNALGIVHNMSMRESNVSKLRDADMIACLIPYLKSPNDMLALAALSSLAGIINEDECDVINSNKNIVQYLLDCLRRGLNESMRRYEGWSCKECGFTIKVLARNDANVKTLVDLGALELLVELGRTGDEDEQYESVSAIWALSFDKKNQSLITGKPELGVVDLLVDLKCSESEKIKKACNGALWTLRGALKNTVVGKYKKIGEQFCTDRNKKETRGGKIKRFTSEDKATSQGHVMISYQWADQDVLKKVRDNIDRRGYKVWMDIDQMGGSTLQAMADAVEGAAVFLLCMSNKYKHSPTCRAEAEYAFQLRKHVIPLKMERGYNPDGWLGFIVGAKLFFEFSPKYAFEDKMKALLKEIDSVLGEAEDMPDAGVIIAPQIASVTTGVSAHSVSHADTASPLINTVARTSASKKNNVNVSKWTADDVKIWIEKNGLQKCRFSSLTGGEIALLASMRIECPEYFYKCLENKLKIRDLLTMSKIVLALQDLT